MNSFSCRCGSFYVSVGQRCLVAIYYLARGKYQPIISVYLYPNSSSNIYIEANDFSLLEIERWAAVSHNVCMGMQLSTIFAASPFSSFFTFLLLSVHLSPISLQSSRRRCIKWS